MLWLTVYLLMPILDLLTVAHPWLVSIHLKDEGLSGVTPQCAIGILH